MTDGIYQVTRDGLCAGFVVRGGKVVMSAPVLRGGDWSAVAAYLGPEAGVNHAGHNNPNAVLTPQLVAEIRRLNGLGFGYLWLSRWLGVTKSCVQKVCNGRTWKPSRAREKFVRVR